jgi:hypothetical protein
MQYKVSKTQLLHHIRALSQQSNEIAEIERQDLYGFPRLLRSECIVERVGFTRRVSHGDLYRAGGPRGNNYLKCVCGDERRVGRNPIGGYCCRRLEAASRDCDSCPGRTG